MNWLCISQVHPGLIPGPSRVYPETILGPHRVHPFSFSCKQHSKIRLTFNIATIIIFYLIHDNLWIISTAFRWQTVFITNIIIYWSRCTRVQPLSIEMRAQVVFAYLVSNSMERLWRHNAIIGKIIFYWKLK